nr:hypothetical protein [Tanacetum cinerariifolium]
MVKGKRAKVCMVTYRDDSLRSMIRDVATFMTLHGKADIVTGLKHNSTGINTFGVPITSKEVLIGLVEKTKAGALDNVISRLTTTARKASHALIMDLARGFIYVNSDSDDTPSEEPNRDITANTCLNLSDLKVTLVDDDTTPNMDTPLVSSLDGLNMPSGGGIQFTSNVVDAYPNSMNFKETTIGDYFSPHMESPIVNQASGLFGLGNKGVAGNDLSMNNATDDMNLSNNKCNTPK